MLRAELKKLGLEAGYQNLTAQQRKCYKGLDADSLKRNMKSNNKHVVTVTHRFLQELCRATGIHQIRLKG